MKIFQFIIVLATSLAMVYGMLKNDISLVCGFGFLAIINLLLIFVDDFGEMKEIQKDSVKVGIIGHLFKRGNDNADD